MAPFLAAVMASAWSGGLGPGLFATGLSMALSAYLFLEPTYSLAVRSADDIAQLVVFSMVSVFVSILNTARKRANELLRAGQERMRLLNDELETRVRERTAWLHLLFEVTRSANQAQTLHQVAESILPLIGIAGGWDYAHALILAPGKPRRFRLSPSYFGKDRARTGGIHQELLASSVRPGEGIPGRVARTREVEWTPDLQTDPSSEPALRKSGLRLRVSIPILAEEDVVAIVECFRDKRAERHEHELELFRTIATELGLVVERKRLQEGYAEAVWDQQRILAQELHDGLGQILAGTGFLSHALSQQLSDPAHSALSHQVTEGIERTLGQIRGLAKGVFPMELEAGGLIPALEQLAASVEAVYAIKCRFECDPSINVQDSQIAIHLYRMAQEAVANAAKHARAAEVSIRLSKSQGRLSLSVLDDGIGISVPGPSAGGSGMRSLRCRAAAIGATLSIEGWAGKGTRILCSLPHGPAPVCGPGAELTGVASHGHV